MGPVFGHRRRFGLGLAVVVSIVMGGCSAAQPSAKIQPAGEDAAGAAAPVPPAPQIREVYRFDSLPVMVATSDGVVLATVTDVQNGRTVGEVGDTLTFAEVTMRVDETLFGSVTGSIVLELDTRAAWAEVGAQSIVFLHRKTDSPQREVFRPVNSQSVFVLAQSGDLVPSGDDEFSEDVARLGPDALRRQIASAATLVEAGEVKPAQVN